MKNQAKLSVPKAMQPTFETIISITDTFCEKHLNEEYAGLSRAVAAALCRKRPSPLTRGSLDIWAGGIVYALGGANFLFDRTQTPHMTGDTLCELFGVNKSSVTGKAKLIKDTLRIDYFNPRWNLPSRIMDNPAVWMLEVNGFIIDIRHAPRELQEKAHHLGLIPFIPECNKKNK